MTKALAAADIPLRIPEDSPAPPVPKAQPPAAAKQANLQAAPASLAAAAPAAVPVTAAPKPEVAGPPVREAAVQPAAVALAAVARPAAMLSMEQAPAAVWALRTDASAAPVPTDATVWSKAVRARSNTLRFSSSCFCADLNP